MFESTPRWSPSLFKDLFDYGRVVWPAVVIEAEWDPLDDDPADMTEESLAAGCVVVPCWEVFDTVEETTDRMFEAVVRLAGAVVIHEEFDMEERGWVVVAEEW